MKNFLQKTILALIALCWLTAAESARIKDIASVAGVRSNQLTGYGLVVGLDGTGDKTAFTEQSFRSMLRNFNVTLPEDSRIDLKNVAAVTITAVLPAFAALGQTIDITVSSIGNAKSLRGGTLLVTPLKGLDGHVYAIAQGNLVVGGFGTQGSDGSRITINVPSVGRIPNGAMVERTVPSPFSRGDSIVFNVHRADFTTVKRLSDVVNNYFGPATARPLDSRSVRINAPRDVAQRVTFMSLLENLQVVPDEGPGKIVINSRTGTIVIGQNVRVSPVAVSHGSLTVKISEQLNVSQPAPLSAGQTVVVPQSNVEVVQENNRMFLFSPGAKLEDVVAAVNNVGAAPGDLMAILEALKAAGALQAELEVI